MTGRTKGSEGREQATQRPPYPTCSRMASTITAVLLRRERPISLSNAWRRSSGQ